MAISFPQPVHAAAHGLHLGVAADLQLVTDGQTQRHGGHRFTPLAVAKRNLETRTGLLHACDAESSTPALSPEPVAEDRVPFADSSASPAAGMPTVPAFFPGSP